MARRFNTAGPCRPDLHYMIPAERRLPEAPGLVEQGAYFVVHAPRQTGKTTALRALADQLTASGRWAALVNGGGLIEREYGLGRGRIDLLIRWPYRAPDGSRAVQRAALELKVWREGEKDPTPKGLAQLDGYLAQLGLDEGVLVLFDRRAAAGDVEARTRIEEARTPSGRRMTLLRA
jgi:hypothetical protein